MYKPPQISSDLLTQTIENHLRYFIGKFDGQASAYETFRALALALRPSIVDRMIETANRYKAANAKRLYYLSMEFLIGQSLANTVHNLGLMDVCRAAIEPLGFSFEQLADSEPDAALGNGGLGRLAACFLESLASLDMPGFGYGVNYEFGLFRQKIQNGYQKEEPDYWRYEESPWIIAHPDQVCYIPVYGYVEHDYRRTGEYAPMWMGWKLLVGMPNDIPIAGYGGRTVNFLRLYSARASAHFNIEIFNSGDYIKAVGEKIDSEKVSKVLYPSDSMPAGRELRLLQEYFLVACSVRDIFNGFSEEESDLRKLPDKVAIQLNDTHPALTVAEMMRLLVDEHHLLWDEAWEITCNTCAYTNHTLLPEALERWPVSLLERVLPRHLQIIYEINHRFLDMARQRWPLEPQRLKEVSLIEESGERSVRMANLAIAGGHAVNGVAALHSELVKHDLMPAFYELWPEKFQNKTNGVTHRRWLAYANPELAALITSAIGDEWIRDFSRIRELEPFADDPEFRSGLRKVKHQRKAALAKFVSHNIGINIDPDHVFDIQIKRIHEYKRQLLHVLQIIEEYLQLVEDGTCPANPIAHIFAGKAAPGYAMAKLIIKLINNVSAIINSDKQANGWIKVLFVPDYRVSLAEKLIPAADISEQISTAGMEASGTGNMKLAMNGALTIGTMDGANIEIVEEVGLENAYIFGLSAEQVAEQKRNWSYRPSQIYNSSDSARRVIDSLSTDRFSPSEPGLFRPLAEKLLYDGEQYFHLADLASYVETKARVLADYGDRDTWSRRSALNIARSSKFSSDRTIREYADEIWNIRSVGT
ncbi:MAG TPA: glycogen/starch/alpha-glucan phosphorylase [Bryobacteraceae bacterium]|nr:glycogen/starch/alpha-glucan phosphorylase [Bryobacteraceae bacterium]